MAKVRVEDCLCLDVVVLTRPGPLRQGFGGTYYFYKDDKEIDSIPWEFIGDCLHFHCCRVGRDGEPRLLLLLGVAHLHRHPVQRKASLVSVPGLLTSGYANSSAPRRTPTSCAAIATTSPTQASKRERAAGPRRWMRAWHARSWSGGAAERSPRPPVDGAEMLAAIARPSVVLPCTLRPSLTRESFRPSRAGGRPNERPYRRTRPFTTGKRKNPKQRLCMKCRDWRELEDPQPVTLPNGRSALKGRCPVCGAKMTAIVKGS